MNKEELGGAIFKTSYLTGKFVLRSGIESYEYFDKYRFLSDPFLLNQISSYIQNMILGSCTVMDRSLGCSLLGKAPDYVAYLEMGAIPLVGNIKIKKSLFVRKAFKGYGTERIIEGDYESLENETVCIVEDVITTGGAVLKAAIELRSEGAIVKDVYCIIDREAKNGLEGAGLKLYSLFTMSELKYLGKK